MLEIRDFEVYIEDSVRFRFVSFVFAGASVSLSDKSCCIAYLALADSLPRIFDMISL